MRSKSFSALILIPVWVSALLVTPTGVQAKCRDPEVARPWGSVAHAAAPDVTIRYFGHNFFHIKTAKGTTIITDPLGPGRYPYPVPDVSADVVTIGREHYNHNFVEIVQGSPLVLRGLANYGFEWNRVNSSFNEVFIYNVPIYHHSESMENIKGAAFIFDLGDLCIAHLGDLSQKLTPQQLKMIGKVDIALTPIGGWRTMAPDLAREVLAQLKPKIAIPMHYRDNLYVIEEFTAGIKSRIMNSDTLVVSKDGLPSSLEIRVLTPEGAESFQ